MRNFSTFFFVILIAGLSSCHVLKSKSTKSEKGITKADFPYIEKFHEGLRLKQKGEIDDAIVALGYCLNVRQDDDAVYFALSELYLMKNDVVNSAEAIKKAAAIDPNNTWYIQELAYMYFEQKNYAEATKCFQKLIKKEPRNVDWLYGYAEALVKTGKTEEAITAFDKMEDQVGTIPELSIQKFRLYIEAKNHEKAIQEIEKARKVFPQDPQLLGILVDYYFQTKQEQKAISMLEEMAKADPENGRVHLGLADIYKQKGKTADYYSELKKAFQCMDVDLDTKMKILIDINDRKPKLSSEDFELLTILTQKYPNDSKTYSIQGDFYLKNEDDEKALIAYKKALEYNQTKFPIWNQVLLMEYQSTNFEALYEDSKKCLEFFPNIVTVYLFNGVSANQLKKYEDALNSLQIGMELVANDPATKAEFYGQIGESYFGLKNYSEGKKYYELAISSDPTSSYNMNNYAYRLALNKIDLERAEQLIAKVNELAPNQAHFTDTYGWVLFQKENYSKALDFYRKAFELDNADKIITEHLGDAYFKIGNTEKAIEYWKKALELGSTNKNLKLKIEKKDYYEPLY